MDPSPSSMKYSMEIERNRIIFYGGKFIAIYIHSTSNSTWKYVFVEVQTRKGERERETSTIFRRRNLKIYACVVLDPSSSSEPSDGIYRESSRLLCNSINIWFECFTFLKHCGWDSIRKSNKIKCARACVRWWEGKAKARREIEDIKSKNS